jgi:hypothetical protein
VNSGPVCSCYLEHDCLRLNRPRGGIPAPLGMIQDTGWSGGQPAWELPTHLIYESGL